ncbi:MAG: gliding motility protein GldC, partial [Flavobacteriales bacterium]
MKQETLRFDIELDDNHVPEKILWTASDQHASSEVKAMIISVWDKREQNTMRIDLWNKEMHVDEMKQFVHQTI